MSKFNTGDVVVIAANRQPVTIIKSNDVEVWAQVPRTSRIIICPPNKLDDMNFDDFAKTRKINRTAVRLYDEDAVATWNVVAMSNISWGTVNVVTCGLHMIENFAFRFIEKSIEQSLEENELDGEILRNIEAGANFEFSLADNGTLPYLVMTPTTELGEEIIDETGLQIIITLTAWAEVL